jgi:hypothetical protein
MRQQETVRDPIEKTTNLGVRGSNPFGRASDFNGLECFAQPAKFGQLPNSSHGSGAERPCLLESGVRAPLQYRCSKPQKIGSCFARRSQPNTVQITLFWIAIRTPPDGTSCLGAKHAWSASRSSTRPRGRGKPRSCVSDDGTELTSMAILAWSKATGVGWHYIQPGKPL